MQTDFFHGMVGTFRLSSSEEESMLSGLGAAWNVADISEGSTVVIYGLGTVGLSVSVMFCGYTCSNLKHVS